MPSPRGTNGRGPEGGRAPPMPDDTVAVPIGTRRSGPSGGTEMVERCRGRPRPGRAALRAISTFLPRRHVAAMPISRWRRGDQRGPRDQRGHELAPETPQGRPRGRSAAGQGRRASRRCRVEVGHRHGRARNGERVPRAAERRDAELYIGRCAGRPPLLGFSAMHVAYQGEPGAYSERAVRSLFPDAEPMPCDTVRLVFSRVTSGKPTMASCRSRTPRPAR